MIKRLPAIIRYASWAYPALVVLLWGIMFYGGDRWWPATILLFSPRWLFSVPIILFVPIAVWHDRWLLVPLVISLLIVFVPFMGFNLPLSEVTGPAPTGAMVLRVLTCNIHTGDMDLNRLSSLIKETAADIVALQECPRELKLSVPDGWRIIQEGELAVLSRYELRPGRSLQAMHPPHTWPRTSLLPCVVAAPGGDIAFCAVHLPSPRYGLQTIFDKTTILNFSRKGLLVKETADRRRTSQDVAHAVASLPLPVIVAGDFNMPDDSTIFREFWGGYANAFSIAGLGYGWTVSSNVRGLKISVRVDHVLVGKGFEVLKCGIGADVGSDHFPLMTDIYRVASQR